MSASAAESLRHQLGSRPSCWLLYPSQLHMLRQLAIVESLAANDRVPANRGDGLQGMYRCPNRKAALGGGVNL